MKKNALKTTDYLPYYRQYIDLAGDFIVSKTLAEGLGYVTEIFEALPKSLHDYKYEAGKWSPKEILEHIIDTERVFAYRALTFARSENAELPGFDQDIFVLNGTASNRTMDSLLNEYIATRTATILFFNSLPREALLKKGIASGGPLSVAAAGFIISGHELHHCAVLHEKYIS
jgi:hypothetical protein